MTHNSKKHALNQVDDGMGITADHRSLVPSSGEGSVHIDQSNGQSKEQPTFAIVDIIKKKRDSEELTDGEIRYFVKGSVDGYITDAQIG